MKRRSFLGRLAAGLAGLTGGLITLSSPDKANGEVGRLAPSKATWSRCEECRGREWLSYFANSLPPQSYLPDPGDSRVILPCPLCQPEDAMAQIRSGPLEELGMRPSDAGSYRAKAIVGRWRRHDQEIAARTWRGTLDDEKVIETFRSIPRLG